MILSWGHHIHSWQLLQASLVAAGCYVAFAIYCYSKRPRLPRVGYAAGWFSSAHAKTDFIKRGFHLVDEGYKQYKNSMFLIQTADMERIVLSNRFVDEIRLAPETQLSVREGMCERHLGEYTTLDVIKQSHVQNDVCKVQLTQNLGRLMPGISEEVESVFEEKLPSQGPSDQHTVVAYNLILFTIARITSRVFVGLPLCREDDWLQTAMGYTLDVFNVSTTLRKYLPIFRPFVAPFLQCTKDLQNHVSVGRKYLVPILRERAREKAEGSGKSEHLDMLQWLTDTAQDEDAKPENLSLKMLFLTLAAVHTSTMSATHALFDLCAMPEYIEPIREEILKVYEEEGSWTQSAIQRLWKLDSFMKESQRINHPGLLSFNRKVMSPLHLSDGTVIPANSFITMATNSIARDEQYYPNPDEFQGFRFHDKRVSSEKERSRHQFVTTGVDSLPFGHGKFACPGRFFAATQVKMVLATILINYDVEFPGDRKARPLNIFSGEGIGPDRAQKITFTPRHVVA